MSDKLNRKQPKSHPFRRRIPQRNDPPDYWMEITKGQYSFNR